MEKILEKLKTRRWPKIVIERIVIISAIALIDYTCYKHHHSLPLAEQIRAAESMVRDMEQSRRVFGISKSARWRVNDHAFGQVVLQRTKNGESAYDMRRDMRGMSHQISELEEKIYERQRERIRKEGRKVTNKEVYQKACEELAEVEISAEEK